MPAAGLADYGRNVLRPVASDLEREAVPHEFTEFHQLASAGRAVGSHLDLGPLAGHDAARLGLHRRRARALAVADVVPSLQHRLVRAVEPVALLHRETGKMTRRFVAPGALAVGLLLRLSGCTNPYDPGQRALSGGLIGCGLQRDRGIVLLSRRPSR